MLDKHGEIRFINPIARQLTGWSEIETMNCSLGEVFVFVDKSSHTKLDILGHSQPVDLINEDNRVEGLLVSKDGRTIPVEAEITYIDNQGNGLTAGMVLVFRDITKHQEALQEIQRQHQRAEALVETAAR